MKRRFTPFLLLCLVGFLARLGYQMARPPVLPRFAEELGADAWLIGVILGASTVTGVLVKFPAGALSDIMGRRRMLLLGAAFFAFPPFLYPLVRDPGGLLALRLLHGLATAIFSPVASAAVADLFKDGRGEKLGWFASAGEMGGAFGPLVGGFLLASFVEPGLSKFHSVYLAVGLLGVLTFLLVLFLPIGKSSQGTAGPSTGQSRWRMLRQGMGEVIRNRDILITSGAESAMFMGVGALLGFLPLYAKNVLRLSDVHLGILIWVPLAMAMAGKPVAGRISDRVGRKPVILVGLALCATVLPLIPHTTHFSGLLAEGALFGIGMAVVTPSTTALVTDLCRARKYGAALGVFGTIWDIGEASGPILAGALIFASGGLGAASAYSTAFVAVGAILALVGLIFGTTVKEPGTVPG